ncbi:MAG: hypothetical protein LBI45_01960 [Bacteroidales bacterium]|jgi:peptidoglycan/xylan/chitin deacetylase (PgdA/CDA1 family)|nr:hypothetical protein [Bacteroidales bacterium]
MKTRFLIILTFSTLFLFSRGQTKNHVFFSLVSDGYEIGCHGRNHIKVSEKNQEQYIETEIEPALLLLLEYVFTISSFASPFGASTTYLDSILTNYFTL